MEFRAEPDNAGATTQPVADDMSAIFGSNNRAVTVLPAAKRPANARSAMPNRLILAVSAGTLSATVAAGIYAGKNVIVTPVETSGPRVNGRVLHPFERRELGTPPATADATIAAPVPLQQPAPVTVATPIREASPFSGAPVSTTGPSSLPRTPVPSPVVSPVAHGPSSAIVLPPAASVTASIQRFNCDDDGDPCLAPRAEVAEQRVADAYEQAVRAGVRPRDLRGYRGEWDRARGVAVEQPRYALRLYAMITSDLLNLADEAGARDGVTER